MHLPKKGDGLVATRCLSLAEMNAVGVDADTSTRLLFTSVAAPR